MSNRSYRVLMGLTLFAMAVCAVVIFLPSEPRPASGTLLPQPTPAEWERQAWEQTLCDRCGRPLTVNPHDGLYLIGGHPYWLHRRCVAAVAKAARR